MLKDIIFPSRQFLAELSALQFGPDEIFLDASFEYDWTELSVEIPSFENFPSSVDLKTSAIATTINQEDDSWSGSRVLSAPQALYEAELIVSTTRRAETSNDAARETDVTYDVGEFYSPTLLELDVQPVDLQPHSPPSSTARTGFQPLEIVTQQSKAVEDQHSQASAATPDAAAGGAFSDQVPTGASSVSLSNLKRSMLADENSVTVDLPFQLANEEYIRVNQTFGGSTSHSNQLFYSLDFSLTVSPWTDGEVALHSGIRGVPAVPSETGKSFWHDGIGSQQSGVHNLGNYVTFEDADAGVTVTLAHLVKGTVTDFVTNGNADALRPGDTGADYSKHIHVQYGNSTHQIYGAAATNDDYFADARLNDGSLTARRSPVKFDTALGLVVEGFVSTGSLDLTSLPQGYFDAGNKNGFLLGNANGVNLVGGASDNILSGNHGSNRIEGKSGADAIWAGGGNDSIFGDDDGVNTKGGDDTIYAGLGSDTVHGGEGNDWIFGDSGESIMPTNEAGTIALLLGDDLAAVNWAISNGYLPGTASPLAGGEFIDYRFGDYTLDSGDDLRGDSGSDTIFGGSGDDTIYGGGNASAVSGASESDVIFGGQGNDLIFGELGDDTIFGGEGEDTAVYADISNPSVAFHISENADGSVTIEQQPFSGQPYGVIEEGKDRLNSVEFVQFGTGNTPYALNSLKNKGLVSSPDQLSEDAFQTSFQGTGVVSYVVDTETFVFEKAKSFYTSAVSGAEVPSLISTVSLPSFTRVDTGETFELVGVQYVKFADTQVLKLSEVLTPPPPVTDDHSDSRSGATVISSLSSTVDDTGVIEVSGDKDVFRISTSSGTTYNVVVTQAGSDLRPVLRILDSSGNVVSSHHYFGGGGAAGLSFAATSGTYYVEVSGYAGTIGSYGLGIADVTDGSGGDAPTDGTVTSDDINPPTRTPDFQDDDGVDRYTMLSSDTRSRFVVMLDGDDYVQMGAGNDTVFGGEDDDKIYGNGGNDLITGEDDEDTIYGGDGNDGILGGRHDDTIKGEDGDDTLVGEHGDDSIRGGEGNDIIGGGDGDDDIDGDNGDDGILGGEDEDTIDGGDGDDTIYGERGHDVIDGQNDDDYLNGGDGNDSIEGGSGNDKLDGEDDDDTLEGEDGNDVLIGGSGDDLLLPGEGDDSIEGNSGDDTISYADVREGVTVDMELEIAYGPEAGFDTFDGIDHVIGSRGDDLIIGDSDHNFLDGENGEDTIIGGAGNDTIVGRADGDDDVAVFRGKRADYSIIASTEVGYDFRISDNGSGYNEGIDYLAQIDFLEFSDVTIAASGALSSAPTANADSVTAAFDRPELFDLLANDTDPDGDTLVLHAISAAPSKGSAYFVGGQMVFDPGSDFLHLKIGQSESVQLAYSVTDGNGWFSAATVDILVSAPLYHHVIGSLAADNLQGGRDPDLLNGRAGNDRLFGFAGEDTLIGGDGNDILFSGGENDNLAGGTGNDLLVGGKGADTIDGGAGQDTLSYVGDNMGVIVRLGAGTGAKGAAAGDVIQGVEHVEGGSGNDTLVGDDAANRLSGNDGDDSLVGYGGADTIDGGLGQDTLLGDGEADNLSGGAGDDSLDGSWGSDTLLGGDGADTLNGGGGNDLLVGGAGADTIDGGAGQDTLSYFDDHVGVIVRLGAGTGAKGEAAGDIILRVEHAQGGSGNDTLVGDDAANRLSGNDGDDSLVGYGGADTIDGGLGQDTLLGDSEADNLSGGAGDDSLDGSWGSDTLLGGDGADTLDGGGGNDNLDGGNGNDTLEGGAGGDTLTGGGDYDLLSYGSSTTGVNVNLGSGAAVGGHATSDVISGFENLAGGSGRDTLTGTSGANTLHGNAGDDLLNGLAGSDILNGGAGDDILVGGSGNDTVVGGNNYDTLYGGGGNDRVWGGNGKDEVYLANGDDVFYDNTQNDQHGRDTVFGGKGNDTINGGGGNDKFFGDDGDDLVKGGKGNDTLSGGNSYDTLSGGAGNDRVWGGNGRDIAYLGNGNDVFNDNTQNDQHGQDTVYGGKGSDTINVGGGDDVLAGGGGSDTFRFNTAQQLGNNTITDFVRGTDLLELSGVIYSDLTFAATGSGVRVDWDEGSVKLDKININAITEDDFFFL